MNSNDLRAQIEVANMISCFGRTALLQGLYDSVMEDIEASRKGNRKFNLNQMHRLINLQELIADALEIEEV